MEMSQRGIFDLLIPLEVLHWNINRTKDKQVGLYRIKNILQRKQLSLKLKDTLPNGRIYFHCLY